MSRVGKYPVAIPSGVTVNINDAVVKVKGKLGELAFNYDNNNVEVKLEDGKIVVKPLELSKTARALWGTTRARINNLVLGVTEGFTKNLEIQGVGYKVQAAGKSLKLALGFSHEVEYKLPEGIQAKCSSPTEIEITGIDKQLVGQVAAEIRKYRQPEPYKGKGIRYKGEYIIRKEGKKK